MNETNEIRTDLDFKPFDNREEFVSVVITYINRPKLLENCVNSIHQHADYPFEIIVVDDHGISLSSTTVKDKISTLILNMGKPLKQPIQQNRGIKTASSKYIMRLEDDVELIRPCFRDMVNILEKPYVGFINPEGTNVVGPPEEYLVANGTKFVIGLGLSGAWCNIFRKDVWREVGGLAEWCHVSNPPFCHKILKHGYWRGWFLGSDIARNIGGKRSTKLSTGRNHYPRLFNMSKGEYEDLTDERYAVSQENYNSCTSINGSVANMDYWRAYVHAVTPDMKHPISSINWDLAKLHGQARWKTQILSEHVYGV